MPQSHNRRKNNTSKKSRVNDAPVPELLRNLITVNKSEMIRMSPIKKDVTPFAEGAKDKLYTFWQTYVGPQVVSSASLETDLQIQIALTSFTNITAYQTLWDSYRILQVTVRFFPCATPPLSGSQGPVYTAIDYDDATTTTLSQLLEYDTLQMCQPGTYFERTFQPRAANALYSGAFTSFGQMKSPWIDLASAGVLHYGLKIATPNGTVATPLYNTTISAVIQFRNIR